MKRIMITGGAGFIGSALIRQLLSHSHYEVLNVDKLTYAANLSSLQTVADDPRYRFVRADVADQCRIAEVLATFRPDAIMHLAAESHVDRSVDGPEAFLHSNVVGTFNLLQEALRYWSALRAIMFDLDCTLVQSEKLKAQSYAIAAQRILQGRPERGTDPDSHCGHARNSQSHRVALNCRLWKRQ